MTMLIVLMRARPVMMRMGDVTVNAATTDKSQNSFTPTLNDKIATLKSEMVNNKYGQDWSKKMVISKWLINGSLK